MLQERNDMTGYKIIEFGHFYINREGDFAVCLIGVDSKYDYRFIVSHANPAFISGIIRMVDREIPDDGSWIEEMMVKHLMLEKIIQKLKKIFLTIFGEY